MGECAAVRHWVMLLHFLWSRLQGPYSSIDEMDMTTERQLLYKKWAHWRNWYKNQPLHHIR